ncbi:hypothetical protein FAZ15_16200 [Sphingobacterium olei]|uniref:Uncharacterized protein n=1 Tax=Sphingobacterium olei TaxID=2571155 RepID=A0A4U0NHL0_9SPHI|nr:hypothetical protein [Sphingobacterium olei]TJZ53580.1 hypothetical protein FAZ15_16200 [Sphingobacterium olei]
MFIEVNFKRDIAQLAMLSDSYGWNVAKLYTGILPEGGGTTRAMAKVGKFNIQDQFILDNTGNFGIGTNSPTEKLSVNGNIRAKEIKVETANWPDYVFHKNYELTPLKDLKQFIKENGHLPEVPKAKEIEERGLSLGEMNKTLMKKIEELTLYLLQKENEMDEMRERLLRLEKGK